MDDESLEWSGTFYYLSGWGGEGGGRQKPEQCSVVQVVPVTAQL